MADEIAVCSFCDRSNMEQPELKMVTNNHGRYICAYCLDKCNDLIKTMPDGIIALETTNEM